MKDQTDVEKLQLLRDDLMRFLGSGYARLVESEKWLIGDVDSDRFKAARDAEADALHRLAALVSKHFPA